MTSSRASAFLRLLVLPVLLAGLSACSSGQIAGSPSVEPPPGEGTFGSGGQAVGVLAFAEPHNLSDGATDSVLRAAKLGIPVAIVNQGPTRGDDKAAVRLDAPLGEVLPLLAARTTGAATA